MKIATPEQCARIHQGVVRFLVDHEGRYPYPHKERYQSNSDLSFKPIYRGHSERQIYLDVISEVDNEAKKRETRYLAGSPNVFPMNQAERERKIEELLATRREQHRINQSFWESGINEVARAITGELHKLPQDVCEQIFEEAAELAQRRFQEAKATKVRVARKGGLFPLLNCPEKIVDIYGANTVIFLSGLCGAGKSTLIKKLRAKLAKHRIWALEHDSFNFPRLVSKSLAEIIEIDPDDFLGDGDWEGEVPASTVEPSMGHALDKLTKVLEKYGIVVIVDAGDNRGQREAILRHVHKIRPEAHIHYAFIDCPPLESLARNKTRKRIVSDKAWLDVLNNVEVTFKGLRKFIVKEYGGTWERVDVSSTKYHQLLEELYQCADTAIPATFSNKRCEHIVTSAKVSCCESNLVLPRWDWANQQNIGFLCPAHFPRQSGPFVLTS